MGNIAGRLRAARQARRQNAAAAAAAAVTSEKLALPTLEEEAAPSDSSTTARSKAVQSDNVGASSVAPSSAAAPLAVQIDEDDDVGLPTSSSSPVGMFVEHFSSDLLFAAKESAALKIVSPKNTLQITLDPPSGPTQSSSAPLSVVQVFAHRYSDYLLESSIESALVGTRYAMSTPIPATPMSSAATLPLEASLVAARETLVLRFTEHVLHTALANAAAARCSIEDRVDDSFQSDSGTEPSSATFADRFAMSVLDSVLPLAAAQRLRTTAIPAGAVS